MDEFEVEEGKLEMRLIWHKNLLFENMMENNVFQSFLFNIDM